MLLPYSWGHGAGAWSYTAEIKVAKGTKINQDGEIVIFDRSSEQEQAKASFKVQPKFEAYVQNKYQEWETRRKYSWESDGDLHIENPNQQIVKCTTTEKTWGRDVELKVTVDSIIVGEKYYPVQAVTAKKAVAPLIKVKSATFSESGGGNGFIIVDKFRGKPVPTPEFVRDDEKANNDKSPIGFYAGQKPVYEVEFEVKPASLASITASCKGGIFSTEERMFMVDGAGKAKDKVEGSTVIPRICRTSPEKGEEVEWSFLVYGDIQLSCRDKMKIHQYYVLLDRSEGDKPWKNLLKAAFDQWKIAGSNDNSSLIEHLSTGISGSSSYNHDGWKPEEGRTTSLYVNQRNTPMPLAVGKMVDAFCNNNAKIICVEAAGLLEYAASVLGQGGVTSRGVNWTETGQVRNPLTGQMEDKSWSNGHGYCLFQSHVHDPVPGRGGPTGMNEGDYINQKLHDVRRSDFRNLRNLNFEFTE